MQACAFHVKMVGWGKWAVFSSAVPGHPVVDGLDKEETIKQAIELCHAAAQDGGHAELVIFRRNSSQQSRRYYPRGLRGKT